ncbi:MAG TPA: acyltransferase [Candidatus Dormibacteraeota bacterium]|nr:acyltransferase [Candidatus Dormibacteraeota bacterium]
MSEATTRLDKQEAATAALHGKGRRLDGVDVIRGLCIMNVVLHHTNIRIHFAESSLGALLPKTAINALFWTGDYAVKIFFVISGFLITSSILGRWNELQKIEWRKFYGMRFARIAPCLLALLVILSALHLGRLDGFTINPDRASLWRALIAALTFHINWLEAHVGYLPGSWDVLWSLSVEETFYLAYPLLCRFVRNRFVLLAIGAALIVAGPFARAHAFNDIWYDYSYLGGMDAIAIGCVTAIAARSQWIQRVPRWVLVTAGVLLVSMAWFRAIAMKLGISYNGLDVTVLAIGAALVILAITRSEASGEEKSWLSGGGTAIVRWYGCNSYEIYLTHMFVVLWGVQIFLWRKISINAAPIWFLGILIVAGLLGEVVARFFSEPMNEWLRRRFGLGRAVTRSG